MYLLRITFYELGQFLEIVLWIFLPAVIIVLLFTTYLHYRRKRKQAEQRIWEDNWVTNDQEQQEPMPEILAKEGEEEATFSGGDRPAGIPQTQGIPEVSAHTDANPAHPDEEPRTQPIPAAAIEATLSGFSAEDTPKGNENWYQALLWMKEKYEEYREEADERYGQLQEELARSQQRYAALLEERGDRQAMQDIMTERSFLNNLVEEKNLQIESLNRLLTTIYKELDKSLRTAEGAGISSWIESTPAPEPHLIPAPEPHLTAAAHLAPEPAFMYPPRENTPVLGSIAIAQPL